MILPPIVQRSPLAEGYLGYTIDSPQCSVKMSRHGAQLLTWRPTGCEDSVIYLSPDAIYEEGTPIRGGMPVCWPWFGPHPTEANLPAHGFARRKFWQVTEASERRPEVVVSFELESDDETMSVYPHPFHLQLRYRFSDVLRVELTATNRGEVEMPTTAALHTYFSVKDIEETHVSGFEKTKYFDALDGGKEKSHENGLIRREVDRVYQYGGPVEIHDQGNARVLTVTPKGSSSTVLWNPWEEKAKALQDLPDEDYRKFLCVESANAGNDLVMIQPGEAHVLGFKVEIK